MLKILNYLEITEIHIFGDTKSLSLHTFDNYNGVKKAIRITTKYRHISNKNELSGFVANGIHINNSNPILNELSEERQILKNNGIDVAFDGMELSV